MYPAGLLPRVHFEEAFAVEAARRAMAAADDRKLLARTDTEPLGAVPGSSAAVAGIEVIVTRTERRIEKRGAFAGLNRPPALAHPVRAVEVPEGELGGVRALVAHDEAGQCRTGRPHKENQCSGEAAHAASMSPMRTAAVNVRVGALT